MTVAYIGIGANLSNPIKQVEKAISILGQRLQLLAQSSYYLTEPVGVAESQPSYINAVVSIETNLAPQALLAELLRLEAEMGRDREGRPWGEARSMDLDLLLFDQSVINTPKLIVPHPRMHQRAFVLVPLHEIAPELSLPDGSTIEDLLNMPEVKAQKIECIEGVAVL